MAAGSILTLMDIETRGRRQRRRNVGGKALEASDQEGSFLAKPSMGPFLFLQPKAPPSRIHSAMANYLEKWAPWTCVTGEG